MSFNQSRKAASGLFRAPYHIFLRNVLQQCAAQLKQCCCEPRKTGYRSPAPVCPRSSLFFFPKFVRHRFLSTTLFSDARYGPSNSIERTPATSNFSSVTRTSSSDVFFNRLQLSSASPSAISHTPFAPGVRIFLRHQESPGHRVLTSRQALWKKLCLLHFPFSRVRVVQALGACIPSAGAAEGLAVCLSHHHRFRLWKDSLAEHLSRHLSNLIQQW